MSGRHRLCVFSCLGWLRKASPWRTPRELVASGIVTTVDQSDIRGLVTGMRSIRQGLPHSTDGRRSPPCDLPKGGPRIPPTVLPTRPVPLALSSNMLSCFSISIHIHCYFDRLADSPVC